jgi:hypothetical protein
MSDPHVRSDADAPRIPKPGDLRKLLAEVFRTRAAQHEEQAQRGSSGASVPPARRASLQALETYAAALEHHGWPLPPKMRTELHLLRSMCGKRSPNSH